MTNSAALPCTSALDGRPASNDSPWVIGDVQGCLDCLLRLVERLPADAPLWLTGDLINRGPQSLASLRWAKAQGDRLVTVLGNHDLHLLAVANGIRKAHGSDTLDEILAAPDRDELIDWLRRRPLAHYGHGWLMVHAGVLPQWDVARTLALAGEVEAALRGDGWVDFLRQMYGNEPAQWHDSLAGADRLRIVVNALTRLRFCTPAGRIDFTAKAGLDDAPPGHLPWFDVPQRATRGAPIVFGHWSALGLLQRPDLLAVDTGCVWGGALTAVRLADRAVQAESCPAAATWP